MIDLLDIFDVYQQKKLGELGALQADSNRRLTNAGDRLADLERRQERMHLVVTALWQLLKAHTALTDADLKRFVEQVDLSDGKLDGKVARTAGAMDCPECARRILKSAVRCPWCGSKLRQGDPFAST